MWGPHVPPEATLCVEVSLVSIKPTPKQGVVQPISTVPQQLAEKNQGSDDEADHQDYVRVSAATMASSGALICFMS